MVFTYEAAPDAVALRQGELLLDLTEHRAFGLNDVGRLEYLIVSHAAVVIVSQDCDLEQDYALRFPPEQERPATEEIEAHVNSLPQVLLCEAYGEGELRARVASFGTKDWRRVVQNQNERYHCLPTGPVAVAVEDVVESIYIDFRKHFTVPTGFLYDRISVGGVTRRAVVPPFYSHQLMQRFYGYQARIAIP